MADQDHEERERGLMRRVWRSVFPGPVIPATDRERRWVVVNTLLLHLRPAQVPVRTIPFTHTFGLGGMSLVLVLLLFATGMLMMFVYEPSPDAAYASVAGLQDDVLFGGLIRGIHHFSANFLVVVVLMHLLRVYLTGGYHGPRRFNWVIGLALLFGILVGNFTGYLLPWDQLSYWAITISTAMLAYVPWIGEGLQQLARGGPEITDATLIGFFTIHTTVVPAVLIVLMAWHFWRVRKARGVVVPKDAGEVIDGKPETVLFVPHLLTREVALACLLTAVVVVTSMLVSAPLGAEANPGMSPNPAKAPWYFLGFQELLLHFHPVVAVVVIPLAAALFAALLPYLGYREGIDGVWMMSATGRRSGLLAIGFAAVATPALVIADELGSGSPGSATGLTGLMPAVVVAVVVGVVVIALRKVTGAPREELLQAVVLLLFVVLVVLTVIGIWFRGEGMALVWPWEAT
ncbi:MAG: cytochrome b N-terminal domain-containing protein [Thermoanaerobaculales bacterium]|nr:cytochrome b N-terminal domain-containing protein [Thermoanaerobaculales bacterium]